MTRSKMTKRWDSNAGATRKKKTNTCMETARECMDKVEGQEEVKVLIDEPNACCMLQLSTWKLGPKR